MRRSTPVSGSRILTNTRNERGGTFQRVERAHQHATALGRCEVRARADAPDPMVLTNSSSHVGETPAAYAAKPSERVSQWQRSAVAIRLPGSSALLKLLSDGRIYGVQIFETPPPA